MLRPMLAADALLEACRWAPDDDAPRLVWADAVGGERGELVVLQCDLARGDLPPAAAAARRRRERELLSRHGTAWSGFADIPVVRAELRRGFVEAIEVPASVFASHGEDFIRRAPLLRTLTATGLSVREGDPLELLRRMIPVPTFWALHGLCLVGLGTQAQAFDYDSGFDGRGDDALRLLADAGALAHLGAFGIAWSGLSSRGVHYLAASGALAHFEQLWLREHDLGGDAVHAVLAHAQRLEELDLYGVPHLELFAAAAPPVARLHVSGITDEALAALGESRAATTVTELRLAGELSSLAGLRAFPRLRALDITGVALEDVGRSGPDLAAALPALRRLRVGSFTAQRLIETLAREIGPQLEELDLRNARRGEPSAVLALQQLVAGDVFDAGPDGWRTLL